MEKSSSTRPNSRLLVQALLLLLALIAVSAIFISLDLDRRLIHVFYSPPNHWALTQYRFWTWLRDYGPFPGILLALLSLIGLLMSAWKGRYKKWRELFWVIFLTFAIGGGLITNVLLKSYWGRPRPGQVAAFGGEWDYHEIYRPGTPGQGTSFPCGDATMGFLFITLAYARRVAPILSRAGLAFGLLYGTLIGIGRIGTGSHFPLDVIWSFGIMTLTSMLCSYGVRERSRVWRAIKPLFMGSRRNITAAAGLAAVLLLFTTRPLYTTYRKNLDIPPDTEEILIESATDLQEVKIVRTKASRAQVVLNAQGFGLPGLFHEWRGGGGPEGPHSFHVHCQARTKGLFLHLNHSLVLFLPQTLNPNVRVNVAKNPFPFGRKACLPGPLKKVFAQVDVDGQSGSPNFLCPNAAETPNRPKG